MKPVVLAAALAATTLTAAPALAQSADTKEDLRCAVATIAVIGDLQDDKDHKQEDDAPLMTMMGFFLGRMDARDPRADLGKGLDKAMLEIDAMKDDDFDKLVARCFDRFETKQKAFGAWADASDKAAEAKAAKKR